LEGGRGIIFFSLKESFEGELKNGNIYEGTYFHENGIRDRGLFKNDKIYLGTRSYLSCDRYTGSFIDGMCSGKGNYYSGNLGGGYVSNSDSQISFSHRYEGIFKDDKLTKGKHIESGTIVYKGKFKNREYDGDGIKYFENKDRYEGGFKEGEIKDGQGIYIFANGDTFNVEMKDSEIIYGTSHFPNGKIKVKGDFKDGVLNGQGTLYFAENTNRYVGEFKNGKIDGVGIFHCDGYKYEGRFGSLKETIFFFANGEEVVGKFVDGKIKEGNERKLEKYGKKIDLIPVNTIIKKSTESERISNPRIITKLNPELGRPILGATAQAVAELARTSIRPLVLGAVANLDLSDRNPVRSLSRPSTDSESDEHEPFKPNFFNSQPLIFPSSLIEVEGF